MSNLTWQKSSSPLWFGGCGFPIKSRLGSWGNWVVATQSAFHRLPPGRTAHAPRRDPTPTQLDRTRAAPEDAAGDGPWIEIAFGPDDQVYLRETSAPEKAVTATRQKWDAFELGVQAGEFDHFAEGA